MTSVDLVRAERTLKALANRRRLAIVRLLKRRKDASVGDIADAIKLSFKATSKHLAVLLAADILEREQRSAQMYYKMSAHLSALSQSVTSLL